MAKLMLYETGIKGSIEGAIENTPLYADEDSRFWVIITADSEKIAFPHVPNNGMLLKNLGIHVLKSTTEFEIINADEFETVKKFKPFLGRLFAAFNLIPNINRK